MPCRPYIYDNLALGTYIAFWCVSAGAQKAEYTRNKGFDDNYYKDLILKALDQHVTMSRPEIDTLLMTKLPEALSDKQKVSKIGNLLTSLRKANEIVFGEKKLWRRI